MIPQVILKKVVLPFIMKELSKYLDYVDKPNELDVGFRDLEQKITDIGFKNTASIDMIKSYSEKIDNLVEKVKSVESGINKFNSKMNHVEESAKDVKWMMGLFKIMKKNPLLKSIFK